MRARFLLGAAVILTAAALCPGAFAADQVIAPGQNLVYSGTATVMGSFASASLDVTGLKAVTVVWMVTGQTGTAVLTPSGDIMGIQAAPPIGSLTADTKAFDAFWLTGTKYAAVNTTDGGESHATRIAWYDLHGLGRIRLRWDTGTCATCPKPMKVYVYGEAAVSTPATIPNPLPVTCSSGCSTAIANPLPVDCTVGCSGGGAGGEVALAEGDAARLDLTWIALWLGLGLGAALVVGRLFGAEFRKWAGSW